MDRPFSRIPTIAYAFNPPFDWTTFVWKFNCSWWWIAPVLGQGIPTVNTINVTSDRAAASLTTRCCATCWATVPGQLHGIVDWLSLFCFCWDFRHKPEGECIGKKFNVNTSFKGKTLFYYKPSSAYTYMYIYINFAF